MEIEGEDLLLTMMVEVDQREEDEPRRSLVKTEKKCYQRGFPSAGMVRGNSHANCNTCPQEQAMKMILIQILLQSSNFQWKKKAWHEFHLQSTSSIFRVQNRQISLVNHRLGFQHSLEYKIEIIVQEEQNWWIQESENCTTQERNCCNFGFNLP